MIRRGSFRGTEIDQSPPTCEIRPCPNTLTDSGLSVVKTKDSHARHVIYSFGQAVGALKMRGQSKARLPDCVQALD